MAESIGISDRLDRRQFLVRTGAASGAFVLGPVLAACGSDEGGVSGKLGMTTDFDYAGKPGGMTKYWDALTTSFGKETGVSVDASLTPFTELQSRMESQFQAQKGPELLAWFGNIHSYQYLDRGVLEPLNDLVPEGEIDNWMFKGLPLEGNFYMAPTYIELFLFVANTRLAEAAGVNLDERIGSWEELVGALERIKADGETPIMMGTKDQFGLMQWAQSSSMAYMDDGTEWASWIAGDIPFDDPAGNGWINQLGELFDKGLVNDDASELNAAEAVKRFQGGEGAFMVMFSGEALALDPEQFQIIPYWDGPGEVSAPVAAAGSGLVMTSYGENKDAATEMLEFQHTAEPLKELFDLAGVLPNDKRFEPDVDNDPMMAQTYELMNSEPEPHWPGEFLPQEVLFDGFYQLGPKLAAGSSAAEVNEDFQAFLEEWRETNPERVDIARGVVEATGT